MHLKKIGLGEGFLTLTQNPEVIKKNIENLTTKTFLNIVWPKLPQSQKTNVKVQENICNMYVDKK